MRKLTLNLTWRPANDLLCIQPNAAVKIILAWESSLRVTTVNEMKFPLCKLQSGAWWANHDVIIQNHIKIQLTIQVHFLGYDCTKADSAETWLMLFPHHFQTHMDFSEFTGARWPVKHIRVIGRTENGQKSSGSPSLLLAHTESGVNSTHQTPETTLIARIRFNVARV